MTQPSHVHHAAAHAWFNGIPDRAWASCATTQLALLRLSSHPRVGGGVVTLGQAREVLRELIQHPGHEYWGSDPEPLSLPTFQTPALVGHRQVTDAYLLGLAAARDQCLATLDRGLATFATNVSLLQHIELVGAAHAVQEPAGRYRLSSKSKPANTSKTK